MMGREGEAHFHAAFEPSGGGEEDDVGGLEWVFGGEEDAAVVDASGEVGVGRAADCEVPFEHVVFEGCGGVLIGGVDG